MSKKGTFSVINVNKRFSGQLLVSFSTDVYMCILFQSFMAGNLYHHLSNLALLAVPFAKRPNLVSMHLCAVVSSYHKIDCISIY